MGCCKNMPPLFHILPARADGMPGGFYICKTDDSGELLYANKALCDIYGCDSLEDFKAFSGFNSRGMIHPDDFERVSSAIKMQITEGRYALEDMEWRIVRKDGETRWVDGHGHYAEAAVKLTKFTDAFAFYSNLVLEEDRKRVLVADDDPVCCESTCESLNDMGMHSEWVLSGKAAVDRVKARREQGRDFFTVILDWKLPDQDGVETTRQIRKLVGEGVPIIIFSACDWTEIEQEAREAGADTFISKPLFRTKLAALFDSLINHDPAQDDRKAPLRELEDLDLTGHRVLLAEDQEINAEIAEDVLNSKKAGMNDHITKPIDIDALAQILQTYIK